MLFGKKIASLIFIINIIAVISTQAAGNSIHKESNMQSFTEKNTIKFPSKEFMKSIGDISALSDIQTYINIDRRIEEADDILGLSVLIQQEPKKIKQINFDVSLDEQLSFKVKDNNIYRIKAIIDNELVGEFDNTLFAKELKVGVLKINEKNIEDYSGVAEIKIMVFAGDVGNRIAQYTFIQNLRNYTISTFPFIKGPQTLGTLSAKSKIFEPRGSLYWIYHNSYFWLDNRNIPEQDALKIAQWIFDHIEFTFAEEDDK